MKKLTFILVSCMAFANLTTAQTKIIAHRGAWKNTKAPQNSIASLKQAIKQKVWGSEFDVHLTKDDILVVTHDNDFYGIDIATSTYDQLLVKTHPNGEKIPTAEDYLKEGFKQNKTKMILEIKHNNLGYDRTLKAAEMSYQLVKKLHGQKNTVFIAFSYPVCLKLRELDPDIKIQYLNGDKSPEQLKNDKIDGLDYNAGALKKQPEYIEEAKKAGVQTNVWTVNSPEDMQYFLKKDVDFITTDEPEKLKDLLKK